MKTIAIMLSLIVIHKAAASGINECVSYFIEKQTKSDILQARQNVNNRVLGQQELVNKVIIALLAGGHILLNGPTGIAKTTLVDAFASQFQGIFRKEQFTVDLSPTDLKGYEFFDAAKGRSRFVRGSLFGNFILADEVNRATPKTQNAMLSAMEEGHVLINGKARKLPDVFFILATQNSEGSVGTYSLPEAQLDRFLFRLDVTYTDMLVERDIVRQAQQRLKARFTSKQESRTSVFSLDTIREARRQVAEVEVSEATLDYIMKIIETTRESFRYPQLAMYLDSPVGPRASIGIAQAAQANAWLNGRSEITREDVDYVVRDVLRHRLKLKKEAITQSYSTNDLLDQILEIARVQ